MKRIAACTLAVLVLLPLPAAVQDFDLGDLATYSIIARDPATGELGMGVPSKAFAAENRAMHAKGGLVVIAHQAFANPMYGPIELNPDRRVTLATGTNFESVRRDVRFRTLTGG